MKAEEENARLRKEIEQLEQEKDSNNIAKADIKDQASTQAEPCRLTLNRLSEKKGRSWMTHDADKKTAENIRFTKVKDGQQICVEGKNSRYNCYKMEDHVLYHVKYRSVSAKLSEDGLLNWSHGYSTRFETDICP